MKTKDFVKSLEMKMPKFRVGCMPSLDHELDDLIIIVRKSTNKFVASFSFSDDMVYAFSIGGIYFQELSDLTTVINQILEEDSK